MHVKQLGRIWWVVHQFAIARAAGIFSAEGMEALGKGTP